MMRLNSPRVVCPILHEESGTWWSVTTMPSLLSRDRYPLPRSEIQTRDLELLFTASMASSPILLKNRTS